MTEELEYIIAQYADGSLDDVQRPRAEALLAADPEARKLLDEYRRLDQALRIATAPPAIDLDRLGALISREIDRADEPLEPPTLKMLWVKSAVVRTLALAAAVVFGIGVAWQVLLAPPANDSTGPVASGPAVIVVSGPVAQVATAPPVQQIRIGPPPEVAEAELAIRYLETGVVARPSRVFIASVTDSAHDMPLPF